MADPLGDFLRHPGAETYLGLRGAVLADPGFDLFSDGLRRLEGLVLEGGHAEALALVPQLMPNWLLSPRTHALIGIAARANGDAARADSEARFAQACLFGLTSTGSGTADAPYAAIHTADEADVLDFLGRGWGAQRRETADGRICDVITDSNGEDHWFDMTESLAGMAARMAGVGGNG